MVYNHDIFTLIRSLTFVGKISFIFEHVSFTCLFFVLKQFCYDPSRDWNAFEIVCLPRMRIRCVVGVQRWRITCRSLRWEYFRCFYIFHGSSLPFTNSIKRMNREFSYKFVKGREKQWIRHHYRSISRRIDIDLPASFAPWKNCFFGLLLDVSLTGNRNSNDD